MHAKFYEYNPFRPLRWRADRVMRMVEHMPAPLKPRTFDDHYVRVYRRFLLLCFAAGKDENQRYAVFQEMPHAYLAHMLHYHPDRQQRHILEARLLTRESLAEIAKRYSTDEKTIEFYAALFFDIRDRLQHSDWVTKMIIGPREFLASARDGSMTEDQRGLLYRFFAYHGGPLALDALIGVLPKRTADVASWLDDALGETLRSRAAAAAGILEINRDNVVGLLKMALMALKQKTATTGRKGRASTPQTDPEYLAKAVAQVERKLGCLANDQHDQSTPAG